MVGGGGGVWGGARIACEQILQLKRSNIKGTHGDGDGEGEEEDNDDDDDDDQTKKWHLILWIIYKSEAKRSWGEMQIAAKTEQIVNHFFTLLLLPSRLTNVGAATCQQRRRIATTMLLRAASAADTTKNYDEFFFNLFFKLFFYCFCCARDKRGEMEWRRKRNVSA